jgi:hypothetical protein
MKKLILTSLLIPFMAFAGEKAVNIGGLPKVVLPSSAVYLNSSGDPVSVTTATPLPTVSAIGSTFGASIVSSTAYEAGRVISASGATLIGLIGYNSNSSAQFFQVFNSASATSNGSVPIATFTVAGTSNFSLTMPISGVPFSTGIYVCNSSTGATRTVGSADCWFTAVIK